MTDTDLLPQASGCLAGVAIGDAMGLPTQFLTPRIIREEYGWIEEFQSAPEWHPYGDSPAGSITDDTEQTLALSEMITASNGFFSAEDVGSTLLSWAESRDLLGTQHTGPSTGKALQAINEGKDPERTGLTGVTNGASMRISPVGIIHPLTNDGEADELIEDVQTICTPTHNTPIGIAGATAVAAAIGICLGSYSTTPEQVVHKALDIANKAMENMDQHLPSIVDHSSEFTMELLQGKISPSLNKRVELALDVVSDGEEDGQKLISELYKVIGAGVDTIESVPTSLAIFVASHGDPMKAVRLGANIGGDTDTIASISGAISGAYAGINAFPEPYREQVQEQNGIDINGYARELINL